MLGLMTCGRGMGWFDAVGGCQAAGCWGYAEGATGVDGLVSRAAAMERSMGKHILHSHGSPQPDQPRFMQLGRLMSSPVEHSCSISCIGTTCPVGRLPRTHCEPLGGGLYGSRSLHSPAYVFPPPRELLLAWVSCAVWFRLLVFPMDILRSLWRVIALRSWCVPLRVAFAGAWSLNVWPVPRVVRTRIQLRVHPMVAP